MIKIVCCNILRNGRESTYLPDMETLVEEDFL